MPLPSAFRMALLAGILAIPVLPAFVTEEEVTSLPPPAGGQELPVFGARNPDGTGVVQSGDRMTVLGQSEKTRRESVEPCGDQTKASTACVSVE
jgi:hypothetical protein